MSTSNPGGRNRLLGRRFAALLAAAAVLVTAALVTAGCGGGDADGDSASAQTGSTTPTDAALVVARSVDLDQLDPHVATTFPALQTLPLVYESLVRLDQQLAVQPGLAESWEFSADNKTLTFKLREGATFADGTPLTSADVKASLERILNPKTAAVAASNLESVKAVKTPDDATVVLQLAYPNSPVLAALADLNTAIVSKAAIDAGSIKKKANGTGPYEIASWTPGESVKLARNAKYWGDPAASATIDFRVIPDEASIPAAVRTGAANIGLITSPVVAKTVGGAGAELVRQPSIDYHALMLNGRSGPLKDQRVRQAIACAIDRQQVLDTAALGEGKVTGPITSPAFLSDPDDRPCPQRDVEKAKELLSEAGHPDGFTLKTIAETGESSTAVAEGQNIQAQLAEVGIKVDLETLDTNAYVKRWLDETFDAAVAINTGRADPDTQYGRYFTSTGSLNKQGGIASKQLDGLFAQGREATALEERQGIYADLSRALEDLSPWVWLYVGDNYYVVGDGVEGFKPMANGSLQSLSATTP